MMNKPSPQIINRPRTQGHIGATGIRPRDAATLILVDDSGPQPRILMGRRRRDLVFMPGKFVFPGGRVDPLDGAMPGAETLPVDAEALLLSGMAGRKTPRRARALAMAAVRETFEETGHLIGVEVRVETRRTPPPSWTEFYNHSIMPQLSALHFAARAITPPGPPRRYDTRFFIANRKEVALSLPLDEAGDGELEDLCWLARADMENLDLPHITTIVLGDIAQRLETGRAFEHGHPVPHYYFRHGQFYRDIL